MYTPGSERVAAKSRSRAGLLSATVLAVAGLLAAGAASAQVTVKAEDRSRAEVLRIACLFNRTRTDQRLPPIRLEAVKKGWVLELPADWLVAQPGTGDITSFLAPIELAREASAHKVFHGRS